MLQCYDIACSRYFYVCRLHNCELVHLQDYVATSFDKPLCIEPEIDGLCSGSLESVLCYEVEHPEQTGLSLNH